MVSTITVPCSLQKSIFADIDSQIKQTEQGTVSIETAFYNRCNLNFVSFIVQPRFTCVPF